MVNETAPTVDVKVKDGGLKVSAEAEGVRVTSLKKEED
jgi:hypothetical protein